jgi:hypothetical protein
VTNASYDPQMQTVTVAFGAEIPSGTTMPHLVIIAPGEKKTFTGCALVRIVTPSVRTPRTLVPRYVQIKVTVLKDVKPFVQLIERQSRSAAAPPLPNDVFEKWIDSVGSVFLNSVPVRWQNGSRPGTDMSAEQDAPSPTGLY